MDIEQIQQEKKKLESEIFAALDKFNTATNLMVHQINLTYEFADTKQKFIRIECIVKV